MPDRGSGASFPEVLVDDPDGGIQMFGWVEAVVDEAEARKVLEDDACLLQRAGASSPVKRLHLRLVNPAADPEFRRWVKCSARAKTGRGFWQIEVESCDG